MRKKTSIFKTIILSFCIVFINGFYVQAIEADNPGAAVLEQGRQLIKNYYIEDVEDSVLTTDNLPDMIKALEDPYSAYFTAKEYEDFVNIIDNRFSGIGIQIEMVTEGVKVTSVFEGTPAEKEGVLPGDIIIEADNNSLKGLSNEQAVVFIRGEEGTMVNLKIKRADTVLEKTVERRQINLPTVTGKVIENHIGYINVTSFGDTTPQEFRKHLDNMKNAAVDSYIIDLRFNGGGYMDSAFDLAGYFIGENPTLKVKSKDGEEQIINASKQDYLIDKPTVFLINEYSASASEILSAAVKDNKKAFFIGTNTYGKGVAQNMYKLSDGNYLKLTVFEFLSPKGNKINKVGISPDFQVKQEADSAVDKALEMSFKLLESPSNITSTEVFYSNALKVANSYVWKDEKWTLSASLEEGKDVQADPSKASTGSAGDRSNDSTKAAELPATGSNVDGSTVIFSGLLFIILGAGILKKKSKTN